jgi:CubicO group peptidase (beta-lactamase class C family)
VTTDRSFDHTNWLTSPHNRQAFQHVRELVPTASIDAGGEVSPLLVDPLPLDDLRVQSRLGGTISLAEHLATTCCDAICVVHDGQIVLERYFNGMHERRLHLLMSVSKSICGAALGIAVGRGQLDVDQFVTDLAPELAGTSLDGATMRHVIDMTAGTDFDEDYGDYLDGNGGGSPILEYDAQAGYRPLGVRQRLGTLGHFRTYGTAFTHGAKFQYRSPLTNIAARVLEVVNDLPYPEIVSRDLWRPLGMEHSADIMLDCRRHPVVEGGMSCTLRDLARFGLAYLDDGVLGDRPVVPSTWIADTFHGDEAALAAYAAQPGGNTDRWSMYRNAFWVIRRDEIVSGAGIYGQYCFVHRPSRTMIARFSTYPEPLPLDLSAETFGAFGSIVEHLASR